LWSTNLDIYAQPSNGNGSHMDMLHGSPFSMGIENEKDNIYWVFDGYNRNICRYNFNNDHGPGNDNHTDGTIYRYTEVKVKRNPAVPSHMVLEKDKKWLYIVDGGNKRVLRMDITTGSKLKDLNLINEPLAQYWEMSGTVWEEVIPVSFGLKQPCGIEISNNRLFVSDFETGEIICFDIEKKKELARFNTGKAGIMGIKLDTENKLWYVNASTSEVVKIEPR
jgi:sugar lactone lactonase YvrE